MALAHQAALEARPKRSVFLAHRGLVAGSLLVLACGAYAAVFAVTTEDLSIGVPLQYVTLYAISAGMAALIARERPGHVVATLFLFMAVPFAICVVMLAAWIYVGAHPSSVSPVVADLSNYVFQVSYLPGIGIPLFLTPLYFPDGKLLSPRWRFLVSFIVLLIGWYLVVAALRPWPWPEGGITVSRNWGGIPGSEPYFDTATSFLGFLAIPIPLLVLLAFYQRFRRSTGIRRTQMKWPLSAVVVISIAVAAYFILPGLANMDARLGYPYVWALSLLFPLSIGAAIVQHHLWDIDVVIHRTILYATLTTLVVLVYLTIVAAIGTMLNSGGTTLAGLMATGMVALLFQPVRVRLQRAIDRLLYGARDDPVEVLTRLIAEMESAESDDAIIPNLARTIARTLKIPYVEIWLADDQNQMHLAAIRGRLSPHALAIPLRYGEEVLGRLVVAPRSGQRRFGRDETKLLATIATLSAPTVRAVQLSDEVRRSRRRIVTAREDERRRLRRDLHDGIGPQLASQTLGLEAVCQLLRADPKRAGVLLESLKVQAEEATVDLRRIVYDLRPPALDDLGLLGALRQGASRYAATGLDLRLSLPPAEPNWPAAVETAVYLLTHEALTNVVRHAEATRCDVRLSASDEWVTLEICDDGRGLPPGPRSGVGLQAMRERTAELGGQLLLAPLPDRGTLVRATLPLGVGDE